MSIVPAVRLLDGVITDRTEGEAFSSACLGADVVSVSWGPTDSGYVADMPGRLLQEAIETCVQQVRAGLCPTGERVLSPTGEMVCVQQVRGPMSNRWEGLCPTGERAYVQQVSGPMQNRWEGLCPIGESGTFGERPAGRWKGSESGVWMQ